MNTKYDIVLCEKDGESGLTKEETIDLMDKIKDKEFYPIEILAFCHECCAMGFITPNAANELDFDYAESGLEFYIANILDNMDNENENCEYEFKGLNIYMSR